VLADTLKPFVGATPIADPYDPRTREWFRKASSASPGSIVWMPPYTFAEGIQGITAASAARDATGQPLGVVTVDFAMAGIAEFLDSIKLPSEGTLMLFTADGHLLAGAAGHGLDAAELALARWSAAGSRGQSTTRRAAVNIGGDLWNVVARSTEAGSGL